MKKAEKVAFVINTLEDLYPETPIPLDHTDAFTLLVAVLLSAQTTDKKVNEVTPELFNLGPTPKAMATLPVEEIEQCIKEIGLYRNKAKHVKALAQRLVTEYDGRVPNSFEALESLPGVGHKTASVVMAQAFNVPAFPVDTHIHRLLWRWTLSTGKNVKQSEADAKRLFPKEKWNTLHLQIIFFGREHCPARGHKPEICPICSVIGRKTMFQ